MKELITKFFLLCVAFQLVGTSTVAAQANKSLTLGSEDHVVYVDINKLPTKAKREKIINPFTVYDSQRPALSFYHKWTWDNGCPTGTLREGVIAYCLRYVGLVQYIPDPLRHSIDKFSSLGPVGILVWYEPDADQFYLWCASWNFSNALGPFVGDPGPALQAARLPRKESYNLTGVDLSVVTQRWLYPDERMARVPRDQKYYVTGGAPSGQTIERQNLNTFITRFRLVNNSGSNIYYLGTFRNDDPAEYRDFEFSNRTDYDRAIARFYRLKGAQTWKTLPHGSSVEFEVQDVGHWQVKKRFLVVAVDTEPSIWDALEVHVEYPSWFRLFSSEP